MSRSIKIRVEAEIHPTADELAEVFWAMDSEEQAQFFNRLGEIAQERLALQLHSVTDHAQLSHTGRFAMAMIGDYSDFVSESGEKDEQ